MYATMAYLGVRGRDFVSYIKRHWQGELPLAIAFWVNVVLLGWFSRLIIVLTGDAQPAPEYLRIWIAAVLSFVLFAVFVVYPWQIVGAWRASERHKRETNRRGWATAAQVMMVLGFFATVGNLVVSFPTYIVLSRLAFAPDQMARYVVDYDSSQKLIFLEGNLGFGVSRDVSMLLEDHPDTVGIVLNSRGGRIGEGEALVKIIKSRRLHTYSTVDCFSACTLAFIAGERRSLTENASLGFHSYEDFNDIFLSMEKDRRQLEHAALFIDQGVSDAFASKLFDASFEDMWYPTKDELLSAGVIHEVLDPREINIMGELIDFDIESIAVEYPIFRLIEKNEPAIFLAMAASLNEASQNGATILEIQGVIEQSISSLAEQRYRYASDSSLAAINKINIERLESFREIDPSLCLKYTYPEEFGSFSYVDYVSAEDLAESRDAFSQVLIDSYEGSVPAANEASAERDLMTVMEELGEEMNYMEPVGLANKSDYKKFCSANIKFFEAVMSLGEERSGNLFRYLFALEE